MVVGQQYNLSLSMNANPLVTISILSFNRLNDLKETLSRFNDIKYKNLEILIIDNNSNDGSIEFIKSLNPKKYRFFISSENLGIGYGRMKALSLAKGDIIISIDDDCFLKPDVIEKTLEVFNNNPNLAAISYGNINPIYRFDNKSYYKESEIKNIIKYNDSYDGVLNLCSSAWRSSALKEINFKKIKLTKIYLKETNNNRKLLYGCIESDLSYELCAKGFNTAFISSLVAFHKISPTNRNNNYRTKESICRFFRMINNYSPYNFLPIELFRGIYLCIYNSLRQRKLIYIKCIFVSMFSNSNNLFKKNRLSIKVYNKMRKLLIEPGFGGKL